MDVWILQDEDLERLRDMLEDPGPWPIRTFRVAVDGGELKFKANEGIWTRGLGRRDR